MQTVSERSARPTEIPAAVERAGRALFGELWQQPLARLLNINSRTIQRIAAAARAGQAYAIAPDVLSRLVQALKARGPEIEASRVELEAALKGLMGEP
jgi:hypothetical protein